MLRARNRLVNKNKYLLCLHVVAHTGGSETVLSANGRGELRGHIIVCVCVCVLGGGGGAAGGSVSRSWTRKASLGKMSRK